MRNYLDWVIDRDSTGCSVVDSQLYRETEQQKKQRVHDSCIELITGRQKKSLEQIIKELDEGDWV